MRLTGDSATSSSATPRNGWGASPRVVLDEALSSPGGGEVVVRSGDVVARVHVQDGLLLWAHLSSAPATMEEVAGQGGVRLERETIRSVQEESRTTGTHFMDVLVQWGLIPEDRAREAVRQFVAGRVELVLSLPDAVALFLPRAQPRSHSARLRFHASEIPSLRSPPTLATPDPPLDLSPVSAALPRLATSAEDTSPPSDSRSVLPLPLEEIATLVNAAATEEGALGAVVSDAVTGAWLFHTGSGLDTEVTQANAAALAALGPTAEEILASNAERIFVTRPLARARSLLLFVAFSAADTTIGMARHAIARLVATPDKAVGPPPPPPDSPSG